MADGSVEGVVEGETYSFKTTGSQTEVGSSENTYEPTFDGTAKAGNYEIVSEKLGTITVSDSAEEVVVTTTGGTFTYDGQAHGATVNVANVPAGYTVETAESSATATDVTTDDVAATADALVIRNARGEDVTSRLNIKKVDGAIKVTPATAKVTTPSASKAYDGSALAAEGSLTGLVAGETATLRTTGSQTEAGSSANTYAIDWDGTAKQSNYKVSEDLGTLTVTRQSIDPDDPTPGAYQNATVDAPKNVEYDASEHKWAPTVTNGQGKELVEGADYTVSYSTDDFTNVTGAIKVTITGIGSYTGTVEREYQITPVKLTVTTGSATKAYDGTALTSSELSITGLKGKDSVTARTTGTQTAVGTSKNTYTITWDGAKQANYDITEALGDLTVTEAPAPTPTPGPNDGGNTPNDGGTAPDGGTTPGDGTTPVLAPVTPAAPANPIDTVANALENTYETVTGNADGGEQIYDEANPLGKAPEQRCWIHFWMLVGMVVTAIYGVAMWLHRMNHTRKLRKNMDGILGDGDEPAAGPDPSATNETAGMEA